MAGFVKLISGIGSIFEAEEKKKAKILVTFYCSVSNRILTSWKEW